MSELANTAGQVARSSIAVIDTISGRGAFKGEELSTIGRLRDQAAMLVQLAEQAMQEEESAEDAD